MILPIVLASNGAFDLQWHNTYVVFPSWHVAILSILVLGILGTIYWFLHSYKLLPTLSIVHSIGTSILFVGIAILTILHALGGTNNIEFFDNLNSIGTVVILLVLLLQILFVANVIIGLIRGRKS